MATCNLCGRANLTDKELEAHKKYYDHNQSKKQQHIPASSGTCPECGGTLWMQEGCHKCPACGYTKC